MEVVKRDGTSESFNFNKVEKVIRFAIKDEEMIKEFLNDMEINVKNNITTQEIQDTLVRIAIEKTSVTNTEWQFVAARLFIYDLYKRAAISRDYSKVGYGSFYKLVTTLTDMNLYGDYLLDHYSKRDIDELGKYINMERDNLFTYAGVRLLADKYLVKGFDKEIYELPQERFMVVAMTLAIPENSEVRLEWAKKFYDCISNFDFMTATPTLLNSGRPHKQLSSCFKLIADDNLWSIYDVNQNVAQLSKYSGGIGLYVGRIRSRGSDVKGFKGASNGIIPWLKNYENTTLSVDQLGSRSGSATVTLDVWHNDIFDFLQIKTNNGDESMKARHLHPAISVPDLFMKQVINRGQWWLFDPHEIHAKKGYRLEDYWGEQFELRYWECIEDPDINKREVPVIEIMKKILECCFETGEPFMVFRDTINKDNPNKHAGMIYSSNLCQEILQNMKESTLLDEVLVDGKVITTKEIGDTVVCNLSSLNLGKIPVSNEDADDYLNRIIPIQIRALDNVIDLNFYPIKEAEHTNKKYRALGAGIMNYHKYLVDRNLRWESQDHLYDVEKLFDKISYYTIKASMELAKEKGKYSLFEGSDWDTGDYFNRNMLIDDKWNQLRKDVHKYGLRNGYLQAIAPTASISIISNATSSSDPVFNKFFIEEKKNLVVPMVAPDLNQKNFWYYKEAHHIDQLWSIKAQAVRQRFLDQGNSFNLFINTTYKAKDLLDLYIQAWEHGLKTVYYVRNQTLDVDDCVSCT